MEQKAGAQIGKRAFIQSLVILFILMMIAGILTLIIPAGQYTRVQLDGRESIDPASFQFVERPNYPIWRWFAAPIEVLGSESGLTVIVIIVVLFFAGGAFAVMDKTAHCGPSLGVSCVTSVTASTRFYGLSRWRSCSWAPRLALLKKWSCWFL